MTTSPARGVRCRAAVTGRHRGRDSARSASSDQVPSRRAHRGTRSELQPTGGAEVIQFGEAQVRRAVRGPPREPGDGESSRYGRAGAGSRVTRQSGLMAGSPAVATTPTPSTGRPSRPAGGVTDARVSIDADGPDPAG